jgi:hypothetical protein
MRDLLAERADTLAHARRIVDGCKGRDLNEYEEQQVQTDLETVRLLDRQIQGRSMVNAVRNLGRGVDWGDGPPRPSMFDEEQKSGLAHALKTNTSYRAEVSTKAALTTSALLPSVGTFVQEGLHPNSQFPLASLFPEEQAEAPVVRYYRMTAGTASLVSEGGLKADAGIGVTSVDMALSKIAATAQFSSESQQDASFLVQALELELQAALIARENQLVLDTFGATSGVLTGSGATTAVVDLAAAAIASMEAMSGITPVAIITHPSVLSTIRQAKATTAGTYFVDPTAKAPQTLHGVALYSTPATPAGTAWLASGPGVITYRRGGVAVLVGFNADDFAHNLNTMIGEERLGVAVTRPSSLYKLTLS